MLAEKNPVVIVVCDENEDKENNNIHKNEHFIEDEENLTNLPSFHTNNIINNNNIPNIEASQQQYTPLIMTSSITGHPSLTKNNSFPLDNNNRKDLLCVPGEFSLNLPVADEQSLYGSMYSIDSSISCHSADEMRCDCFLRKTRGDSFLSIMESMPENTMFTGMSMKCASAHNLLSTGSAENSPMPKIRGTRSHGNHNNNHLRGCHLHGKQQSADDAAFPHKSLKRTISVPLKTSKEQLTDSKTRKDGESRRSPNTSQVNYFNFFSPKVWKRSFLKMNDEKGASRFSLRRTFSLRSSTSANNGEGGQIAFPTKHKKKTQKYKIVEAKTGQADGISFELVNKQGCFLRVKGTELIPDRDNGSDTNFNKDVTFVPLPDMWFPSFFAFESVSKPSYFVRLLPEEELVLDKYDGTKDFKKDASFRLSKKPDATILKKDVQAWVKSTNGEYYLGKILFVNEEMVKVEFSDGRQERCLRSESYKLIPDIVPCPTNLRVGVRVISQFGHRHRFYPGVISSVRRNDSYDILFDDGDCGRGKSYQMRLLQNFPINASQEDSINKENKPPASPSPFHHSPVKLVFSDPGSGKDWPKFEIGSPSVASDTTSCTSTGDVSLKPTTDHQQKSISNGFGHNNGNGHPPFPRWEIESCDEDTESLKNGNIVTPNGTRRRKHGWVPSPLATENNSDAETHDSHVPPSPLPVSPMP